MTRPQQKLVEIIEKRGGEWLERIPVMSGNRSGVVDAGDGKIWIRFPNGDEWRVLNTLAPLAFDRHIQIGRLRSSPNIWRVAEVRENYLVNASDNVKAHHQQHEYKDDVNSFDIVWVNRKQITQFTILVSDPDAFTIQVYGDVGFASTGAILANHTTIDLSSYIPGVGANPPGAIYAAIELEVDGSFSVHTGDTAESKELLTAANVPIPDVGKSHIGYVLLYETMETLLNSYIHIPAPLGTNYNHTHPGEQILLQRLGSTVVRDLQSMQDFVHSAGWLSGGEITDNGDGTIDVAAGTGLVRAVDDSGSTLFFCDWEAVAGLSLTDDQENWIYVDYNGGTPIVDSTSVADPSDQQTIFLLAVIFRTGTDLHINHGYRHTMGDHAGLMMQSMIETMPFANAYGADVAEVGTLQFSISAAKWWFGLTPILTPAFDGTTDTFNYYYRDGGGGWTESTGETAIDPDHYDDNSGTLAATSAARYTCHWVYIATNGDVHVVYSQGQYATLAEAQAQLIPANVPPELSTDSRFLIKIIVKKGETSFTSIESALLRLFQVSAGSGAVDSVNGLTGVVVLDQDDIGDGTTYKQYSATEKTKLAGIETAADVTDIGNVGSSLHGASADTPLDADELFFWDAVDAILKKITWANIKATLKTYFDTLYAAINYGVVPYTSTANVYRSGNPSATSTFTALINGAPTNVANSVVTFDTISVGNATVITPSAAGQLARMRLYNNTRGNYALVVSVSGSTVTVDRNVTTLPSPWQDNDSISTLATGATIGAGGAGINYAELEVIDATLMGKSALLIEMTQRSSVANEALGIHPYTAYIASKEQLATCTVANIPYVRYALVPLTSNVLGIWWNGTGNTASIFKIVGYQP